MRFSGRALYNLLSMNPEGGGDIEIYPWQVEDYRALELEGIFVRLSNLSVDLNQEMLTTYFEETDSPEELAHALAGEEGTSRHEQIYLLIFEIWRRLCRDKEAISIFCDELDHQIATFNAEQIEPPEMENGLATLEHILDTNADCGVDPTAVFQTISSFLAHDLERFLYDFTALQMENRELVYASELIDHFFPYVEKKYRFDFLRLRNMALCELADIEEHLDILLDGLEQLSDRETLFEVLDFTAQYGESEQFLRVFSLLLPEIDCAEEFQELISTTMNYFESMNRIEELALLSKMIKKIGKRHPDTDIEKSDLDDLLQITLTGLKSM